MTNIEQIHMAREELTAAFKDLRDNGYRYGLASFQLRVDAAELSVTRFTSIQGQALVQATQVADENFERAQSLAGQVQENVKHIEALAERRGEEFSGMVSALSDLLDLYRYDEGCEELPQYLAGVKALALAKGEVA